MQWVDEDSPLGDSEAMSGTAFVNVYEPATIAVTTNPTSGISIEPGGSFTMTATLSGGYSVEPQTIHAVLTTGTSRDISFDNNNCALNSINNYSCTITVRAAANAAEAPADVVTLSNTTTSEIAPNPATVTFGIAQPIVRIYLPQTGQTPTAPLTATAGMDGFTYIGVPWAYVTSGSTTPATRFIEGSGDEADCITDNLTGLMWVKDLNTVVIKNGVAGSKTTWQNALDSVSDMNTVGYCGHQDWYLPTINDLSSLLNDGYIGGSNKYQSEWLISQGFSNVQANLYWSSSTYASNAYGAWDVYFVDGSVDAYGKADSYYVWPVRLVQ